MIEIKDLSKSFSGQKVLDQISLSIREMGQKPLTTAQTVDEICDFVANQQAVFLGGQYILQGNRNR